MASVAGDSSPGDLFENAPCGYLVVDDAGKVISLNGSIADWLGVECGEIVGSSAMDFFNLASQVVYETSLLPVLRLKGSINGVSLDLKAQNGTIIPVIISAESQGEGPGRVTRIVLLKAGRRRDFERELVKARAEAESLLSMKEREGKLREQFIAIVGHDLRNPIAAVSAGLRILSRQKASGEKTEALIPEMQRALNRASQIITNLLDFARGRLGRGGEIDAPHAIDLKPVFSDVVGEIRQIAVQPIEAVFDLLHPIRADPQRLGQLLSNLLGNAILHGAPGEVVKVDCGLDGENLRLSVNNQGKPIPPELQASLFQPFERGGDRDSLQGLGLGLYIASEIARAHKGRIDIESSASKGTTFTLTMPARFE